MLEGQGGGQVGLLPRASRPPVAEALRLCQAAREVPRCSV